MSSIETFSDRYKLTFVISFILFIAVTSCVYADTAAVDLNLTEAERQWLQSHPRVELSIGRGFEPFVIEDHQGQKRGTLIDIAQSLETLLGTHFITQLSDWPTAINKLNKQDVTALWLADEQWAQQQGMLISTSLITSRLAAFSRKSSTINVKVLENLQNQRIAVVKGFAPVESRLSSLHRSNSFYRFNTVASAMDAVITDQADIYLGLESDYFRIEYYSISALKLAYVDQRYMGLGIAVNAQDQRFVSILNKALHKIGQMELRQIHNRWMSLSAQADLSFLSIREKQWLSEHPVIHLAVMKDKPPSAMLTKDGRLVGVYPDWMRYFEKLLGVQFKLHPLSDFGQAITDKRVDAVAGLNESGTQSRGLLASIPYMSMELAFYQHADSPIKIRSLQDLKGKRLVHVKGQSHIAKLLREQVKAKDIVIVDKLKSATTLIQNGEADIFCGWLVDQYFINKYLISGVKVGYLMPSKIDFVIGVSPDSPPLVTILDKSILAIGEDKLYRVFAKWLNRAQASNVQQRLYTRQQRNLLNKQKRLRLGFGKNMEPMLIENNDGLISGVVPDAIALLEERLSIDIEIVIDSWKNLFERAKTGEIDGIIGSEKSTNEQFDLLSSHDLTTIKYMFYMHKDSPFNANNIQELKGKRIVTRLLSAKRFFESTLANTQIELVGSAMVGMNNVIEGQADVYIGLSYDNYHIIKSHLYGLKRVYFDVDQAVPVAIGLHPSLDKILPLLNIALKDIGQSKIDKIIGKWLGLELDDEGQLLSGAEQQWIDSLGQLNVLVVDDGAPFEYLDENAMRAGITTDYIKILSELLGIPIKWIPPAETEQAFVQQLQQKADVAMVIPQFELGTNYFQSDVILSSPLVVMASRNLAIEQSVLGLKNKTLAVFEFGQARSFFEHHYPQMKTLHFPSIEKAIQAVADGEADAVVANVLSLDYWQRELFIDNLKIILTLEESYEPRFTVGRHRKKLIPILNRFLKRMPEQQKQLIYEKWTNLSVVKTINWKPIIIWASVIAAIVALIMMMMIYWNRRLAIEVEERRIAERKADDASHAKSLFLANMSHEIRTPMNAILGFSEIIEADPNLSKENREFLSIINSSGNHLLKLINDILDISKIEAGRIIISNKDIDCKDLLLDIHNIFRMQAEKKGLVLNFYLAGLDRRNGAINTDAHKLRQIIINLLGNAIKFTETGSVSCIASIREKTTTENKEAAELTIEIVDTGAGIKDTEQHKVFSTFEQTSSGLNASGGTGLGLAISQEFARLMGGDITFTSDPGIGSRFKLVLPVGISSELISAKSKARIIGFKPAQNNKKILLVDDVIENRTLLCAILKPFGFQLFEATDGLQAIESFKQQQADLILMDRRMPKMGGLECTKIIRKMPGGKKTAIILLTASAMESEKKMVLAQGIDHFMHKPFKKDELLKLVGHIFQAECQYQAVENVELAANTADAAEMELIKPADTGIAENHMSKTVLIVDDNPINRIVAKKFFSKEGYTCKEAVNGKEAIDLIEKLQPDLLLLDMNMPVMSGYEVLDRLQEKPPTHPPKIIVYTAENDEQEEEKALAKGAHAFCGKPLNTFKLKETLARLNGT